jgi:hypothetical protein
MARASAWLPLVVRLRTDEGRTWDDVVRAVNARAAGQGGRGEGQPMAWTKARLVRAVRALVRDGLAPETVIAARGHQRTAVAQDRQAVVRAVAAVVGENPRATLQEVADRLAALRLYPVFPDSPPQNAVLVRFRHDKLMISLANFWRASRKWL